MRKVFTIKKDNYLKHLNDPDIDYNTGLTRFKCEDKNFENKSTGTSQDKNKPVNKP